MSLFISKRFPRTGSPHISTLVISLTPLMAVAKAGSFYLLWDATHNELVIEQGDWTGVDLAAVGAAVDAAPVDSPQLQAQDAVASMPLWEKAVFLSIVDLINVERARHSAVAITPAELIKTAKQKAANL